MILIGFFPKNQRFEVIHAKNKIVGRIIPSLVLSFWDKNSWHAPEPYHCTGFSGSVLLPGSRAFKLDIAKISLVLFSLRSYSQRGHRAGAEVVAEDMAGENVERLTEIWRELIWCAIQRSVSKRFFHPCCFGS